MLITQHPKIPAAQPSPQFLADARQVVANPERYAHRPMLRRLAWEALMTGRGRQVDARRLAEMPVEVADV